MSIKAQIKQLAKLQAIESDITQVNRLLAAIPEELQAVDKKLSDFYLKVENNEKEKAAIEKQFRNWEGESQSISARIDKEKSQLNAVKNNKEYQALLVSIDHLNVERSALEDKMIEALEKIDESKTTLKELKEGYRQFEAQMNRQKMVIDERGVRKENELKKLTEEKKLLLDQIDSDMLKRYKHVQTLRGGGAAVAAVMNEVCKGCNMNIPPQMFNELQRYESLIVCPNCQRIIYYQPADDVSDDS